MKRNTDIYKLYMEAGLAVLIALYLGLAGSAGVLSPRAAENKQTEVSAQDDGIKAGEENENKTPGIEPGYRRDEGDNSGRSVSDHGKQ